MIISETDISKLKLIDQEFSALTLEQITDIFSSAITVDKLKGVTCPNGPLIQAVIELSTARADIDRLSADCMALRTDMTALLRFINGGMNERSQFDNLKMRHSIY